MTIKKVKKFQKKFSPFKKNSRYFKWRRIQIKTTQKISSEKRTFEVVEVSAKYFKRKKNISSVGSVRKMAPSSSSAFYLLERLRDLGKCIFDMSTQLKLNNSESSEDAKAGTLRLLAPIWKCLWVMDWLGLVLGTGSKKCKSKLFSSSINGHLIFWPGFVQKAADS